jgi:predicted Rossmann fold nucleotide-binding protein DprA/Smf involved in DNA uptake
VAVIGTGADRLYPARNRELALAVAEHGAIVSEFPLGTPAIAANFPRRNRIISGLARGVLVVEAAPESGSLITARLAAEQGREVFAIPGSIHSPVARGCHKLIKQGAKLVETAAGHPRGIRQRACAGNALRRYPAARRHEPGARGTRPRPVHSSTNWSSAPGCRRPAARRAADPRTRRPDCALPGNRYQRLG